MFTLSKAGTDLVASELKRYETAYSAIIPSLFQVQKENGWVPPEAVPFLSKLIKIP